MKVRGNGESILVTGGAGYIGSQVTLDLKRAGFNPVILDNFSTGNKDIAHKLGVPIHLGHTGDPIFMKEVLSSTDFKAVMHFAAFTQVGESVSDPAKYYLNNVGGTLSLLQAMRAHGIKKLIFSSTAAVYGMPKRVPISEDSELKPINPYGWTKLVVENILSDLRTAEGFESMIFRYFNAAGADESGTIGEKHDPETHLIPLAIMAAARGTPLNVYGDDYSTPDGTCVRDYVHVQDISQAHLLGLEKLLDGQPGSTYNIGGGNGHSVNEVVTTVENVLGKKINTKYSARRPGDPPSLVASPSKIYSELGWEPHFSSLEVMVKSAWNWMKTIV